MSGSRVHTEEETGLFKAPGSSATGQGARPAAAA